MNEATPNVAPAEARPDLIEFEKWECPIHGCEFVHLARVPNIPPLALASVFGVGVLAATSQASHRQSVELALRGHFRTHTTEDYLGEITRLRALLTSYGHEV